MNLYYELREQLQRRTMLYLVKGLPKGRSTSTRKPFNTLRHLQNLTATPSHLDGQQTEINNTIVPVLLEKAYEDYRASAEEQ